MPAPALPHASAHPTSLQTIVEAIRSKKGERIVSIDLRGVEDAVTEFFVICEAESTTQVRAIAQGVEETYEKAHGEAPWHVEGLQNLQWVLLDYVTVVVHIFLKPIRAFYQLEELWSDGILVEHST